MANLELWACLIISTNYGANDKPAPAGVWAVIAVIAYFIN